MEVQRIVLPDFVIADFYKESLVSLNVYPEDRSALTDENSVTDTIEPAPPDEIKYLGENKKNVIIIVNQPDSTDSDNEETTFLTNILKACGLTLSDIAIVNTALQQVTYTAIKNQLQPAQIILFGVEPSFIRLPFIIPLFQVQNYDAGTIMLAPALSVLNKQTQEGKLLKTKLWNSLKQVFKIS